MIDSSSYSRLLHLLTNRRRQHHHSKLVDDSADSNENTTDIPYTTAQSALTKRRVFMFPRQHDNRRSRPWTAYGRKSHWDAFFG